MSSFDYIEPVSYTLQDNNSYAYKRDFLFKSCDFQTLNPSACSAWISEKCDSDREYCQPFVSGDIIYNQIPYNPFSFNTFEISLLNIVTGEEPDLPSDTITTQEYYNASLDYFLNFNIDTSKVDFSCFQIKLKLGFSDGKHDPVFQVSYSEPYCKIKCEQKSILVEGTYPSIDCNGHFYGVFVGGYQSIYKSIFRIYGEVIKVGFDFEQVQSVTPRQPYTTKGRTISRYRLYTSKIPPYVSEQLAQCFGAQFLFIDGEQYLKPSRMNKDFDEGASWIPLVDLVKECDQIDFTCVT